MTRQTEFPGEFSYKSRSPPKGITANADTDNVGGGEIAALANPLLGRAVVDEKAQQKEIIRRADCLRREDVDAIH